MTGATRAGRRWRWHPVSVGGGLLLASAAVLALGVRAAVLPLAPLPLAALPLAAVPLAGWLVLGVAAGFATSGST